MSIAKKTKFGDGFDPSSDYGPLNNQMQLEKVSALVEDARKSGCDILCGGKRRKGTQGYFYEPTIVSNIKEGVRLWDEEQFGPVRDSPHFPAPPLHLLSPPPLAHIPSPHPACR